MPSDESKGNQLDAIGSLAQRQLDNTVQTQLQAGAAKPRRRTTKGRAARSPVPSIYSSARWRSRIYSARTCPWRTCSIWPDTPTPRATQIYDGRRQHVTRNIVERVSI